MTKKTNSKTVNHVADKHPQAGGMVSLKGVAKGWPTLGVLVALYLVGYIRASAQDVPSALVSPPAPPPTVSTTVTALAPGRSLSEGGANISTNLLPSIQQSLSRRGAAGNPFTADAVSEIAAADLLSAAALAGYDPQSGRKPPQPSLPGQRPPAVAGALAPLTLDDVLALVSANHPKLRGAALLRDIAASKRMEKQGAFDPILITGADYVRFNTEFDAKTQRGKVGQTWLADAGVEFLTRYGLKVASGTRFNLGKVKAPLSPTGNGGEYFMEFKVPFLRGARINEKTAAERQALLGEPLADTEIAETRLELLLKAANSYWDWVAAKRKLDVARDLLKLAEFRAEAVRERVNAGDLPAIDATEAELEVQRRQGNVVKADRDLQKAAFKLSFFLWLPNGQPALSPEPDQVPVQWSVPLPLDPQQERAGLQQALAQRPELQAIALNQQITQVDLDLARNQRRPIVDLSIAPGRDTGFGSIGSTLKFGVTVGLPLRQRTADGRIGAATFKLQKLDYDLAAERQRIALEVRDALSAITTAYERFRFAQQEADSAQRLEEGERLKFQLGDSTLFLVNQRERATAEARIKLVDIQAEYEQAVAVFRAATVQF